MNVAVPIYKEIVSPRLDMATELRIFRIINSEIQNVNDISIIGIHPLQILNKFIDEKINVVICGAANGFCLRFLYSNGIDVIPGIAGKVDEIMNMFLRGELQPGMMCMGRGKRKRFRKGPWF